jgi:hypothetical protein
MNFHFPVEYDCSTAIRARFVELFEQLDHTTSAIALRRRMLKQYRPQWRLLRSTRSCLLCMVRASERMFPCGHSLCEECIQTYYPRSKAAYTYAVGACQFCGIDALTIYSMMPITVEPNLAAIDGGGVRGVVALVLLQRLQSALDTGHPLRDYFDYFIGTSAGMCWCMDSSGRADRVKEGSSC